MKNNYNFKFFQNKNCEFFPCHKIANEKDFNCLFCYCPIYSLGDKCGGDFKYLENGIKDCSDCTLPHIKKNYQIIVDRVSILVDKVRINNDKYKIHEILLATNNPGKLKDFQFIVEKMGLKIKIKTLHDFKDVEKPVENKNTFKDNSILKAIYYGNKFKIPVIADDSGICVEALDNFPGVISARWLNDESQEIKNSKLIEKLNNKNKSNRNAKFVCALTFYDQSINFQRTFFGEWRGKIGNESKGTNGFGYDPIFICDKYNKTAAEISNEIKNKVSHRAVSFMGFLSWLSFFS